MRQWYPGGDVGVIFWTLPGMVRLVRQGVADPLTVMTARRIVRSCPPRDVRCEALSIRRFLARHFRFVRDPVRQETLTGARLMLEQIQRDGVTSGDCDDAAVLGATLAAAIGHRPHAVAVGFRPRAGTALRHVFATLPLDPFDHTWLDLDVTRPYGMPPLPVTRTMRFKLY